MKTNILKVLIISIITTSLSYLISINEFCTTYFRGFPIAFVYEFCLCEGDEVIFKPFKLLLNLIIHFAFIFILGYFISKAKAQLTSSNRA